MPERATFLDTVTCSGEDGDSLNPGLTGDGDYRRRCSRGGYGLLVVISRWSPGVLWCKPGRAPYTK
jgi:hypothetical protein